jgi:hypothetical protein
LWRGFSEFSGIIGSTVAIRNATKDEDSACSDKGILGIGKLDIINVVEVQNLHHVNDPEMK